MLKITTLRKLAAAGAASVCALVGVQGIVSAPASAMLSLPFDGQLAPASGSFGRSEPGGSVLALLTSGGVAINDFNGETYVAEVAERGNGEDAVAVLSAGGSELSPLDGSATPAGSFGANIRLAVAANNATGSVYVMDATDNAIDVFDSAGNYVCQITGAGSASTSPSECDTSTSPVENPPTPAGGFNNPHGLAVDQATGEIFVLDSNNGVVDVFDGAGTYERQLQLSQAPGAEPFSMDDLAVSAFNGHVYVADGASGVYEFDATGTYVADWTGENTPGGAFGLGELNVAANDSNGDVYITASGRKSTYVFDSIGTYLTQFSHSYHQAAATAVDQATGKVYVADGNTQEESGLQVVDVFGPGVIVPDTVTEPATEVEAHKALLHGSVGPDETQLSDCRFEYGAGESFSNSVPCEPAAKELPIDNNLHQVTAQIEGLKAGTTYHFRLAAANAAGTNTGGVESFSTLPPPSITGDDARNLTGSTAELVADINPEGAETTYHFEYDTSPYTTGEAPHGKVAPGSEGTIQAGNQPQPVTTTLTGLKVTTTYYWRVVATNSRETTLGPAHSLRYSQSSNALPDNRAYEIVTPPEKNGALLGGGLIIAQPQVAGDGDRVMGASIQCFADAQSCTASRQLEGEPYSFTRTTAGWQATALTPAHSQTDANTLVEMDADTGTALFSMPTPPIGEDDFYVQNADGTLVHIGPATPTAQGATFLSHSNKATPDLSTVVFQLGNGVPYELSGSNDPAPSLIAVSGGAGSTALIGGCGAFLGSDTSTIHILSPDGTVIYFTVRGHRETTSCPENVSAPATNELYARIGNAQTVAISQRSPLDCTTEACHNSPPGNAIYEDASADGKQVFFTDTQQLTDGASQDLNIGDSAAHSCTETEGANGCNLYEFDFTRAPGHNLVAVSAGDTSGLGPEVQRVMAVSDDGSHVYFIARGVLTAEANDQHAQAVAGGENLYVYERDPTHPAGQVAFIATLSALDQTESPSASIGNTVPNVTPDGRFLVFTSHADLTADDSSTSGAAQIFRYDSQAGHLVRISVGEDGFDDNGNTFTRLCAGERNAITCAQDAQIARNTNEYRRDQTMSDDGSYVFFTSPVGLTAHALNNVQIATNKERDLPVFAENVYEYHDGQVYLISDGKDTSRIEASSAVQLLGSDRTGVNVFFSTADQLVPQDTDTQRDYYDARICTVASPCIPPTAPLLPPCLGEACHGVPAAAPARLAPASALFSGEGNILAATKPGAVVPRKAGGLAGALKVCHRKRSHRKRSACERQARRRYQASIRHKRFGGTSRKGGK